MATGESIANRTYGGGAWPLAIAGEGQPGDRGGNTIIQANTGPTLEDWENIFGPAGRDAKFDVQRFRREGRLHLPSVLEGVNHYLTDKIDGLITDATNSPFTTIILPYVYLNNPDAKFSWNRYSFDEGLASRVPYESAARTLAQTRKSYEGYTIRQGLAVTMEHNFMMSPEGRENFMYKWKQVIGSIQKSNDLDVHMALITAPTYATELKNKYYSRTKTPHQIIREHIDMFGFMQKNVNAMDILIEDAKVTLQTWGSPDPTFMLVNSKLTFQMTMTPEKTNFITQGYDGVKRLRAGPFLDSYRGLNIIHSRQYSLETGAPPRDLLRRRVRVAEYYRIPWSDDFLGQSLVIHHNGLNNGNNGGNHNAHQLQYNDNNHMFGSQVLIDLYDESKDTFFTVTWQELLLHAALDEEDRCAMLESLQGHEAANVEMDLFEAADEVFPNPLQHTNRFVYAPRGNNNAGNAQNAGGNAQNPHQSVLFLQDTPVPREISARTNEMGTFYRNSGLFPLQNCYQAKWNYGNMVVSANASLGPNQGQLPAGGDGFVPPAANRLPLAEDVRKVLYTHLMLGKSGIQVDAFMEFVNNFGMRPNLHVGSMVYSMVKPQAPRFVHIAANIFAQVVVTKKLANSLLQIVHKPNVARPNNNVVNNNWNQTDENMYRAALACMGINAGDANFRNVGSYFGVDRSLLVYLAASVLHPDQSVRLKFKEHLKLQNVHVDKIAESLVTFIKFFISSLPMSQQKRSGNFHPYNNTTSLTGNYFNCFEQGKRVETIFESFAKTEQINVLAQHPTLAPVVYLGPLKNTTLCAAEFGQVQQPEGHLQTFLLGRNWQGDIDREVLMSDFTGDNPQNLGGGGVGANGQRYPGVIGHVYPSNEKLRQEDYLAITKSINAQDCMVAFCQIMLKRFFFVHPQFFVETESQENHPGHRIEDFENPTVGDPVGDITRVALTSNDYPTHKCGSEAVQRNQRAKWEIVIVRPNIEHNMLGTILGRGGINELGATFWGQTELSCYDDSMHGIWGMSYKYHERAMVTNEKNLIRLWDIAYDGYNGGKDDVFVSWTEDSGHRSWRTFKQDTANTNMPYSGPSIMVMAFKVDQTDSLWERNWPSPIIFHDSDPGRPMPQEPNYLLDPDNVERVYDERMRVFGQLYNNKNSVDAINSERYKRYYDKMPKFTYQHATKKTAGQAVADNESVSNALAFQGTMVVRRAGGGVLMDVKGSGHHGVDYIGAASVRSGKGYKITGERITAVRQI